MTSREAVKKSLEFSHSGRIPRHLWYLPWAEEHYPHELGCIRRDFPDDIVTAPRLVGDRQIDDPPERYRRGTFVDEWGCVFDNAGDGTIGIVRRPLIGRWQDLDKLQTPDHFLDLNRQAINHFCRQEQRYVLAGTWVRPFERLQFLRTSETLFLDLLENPPELAALLRRVHRFYLSELEAWAQTDVDGLALMDDWGSQTGLLLDPALFRRTFKPLYAEYAEVARRYRKHLFFHSDGYIMDIIPDLIEVGVNALNGQIFCMGVEELGRRFRGRMTFWGEIDRQQLLARGSVAQIREAVRTVHEHLYATGGVIAQCEFGAGARPENVRAVFAAWQELEKESAGK